MKQLSRYALAEEFSARLLDDGRWVADVDRSWWGWSGPHGGVIAALAVHVAAESVPEADVRAVDLGHALVLLHERTGARYKSRLAKHVGSLDA